ncbi:MAG TPA: sialate O-acetylesterase [Candidatus Paceibacterota bacterium]|nr:sialate O-acetylesterase [Verrucomicrobiota bacterium]HSA11731.1 sialate O-acetylesterase [Candidatus Paceibacterota bacterium]
MNNSLEIPALSAFALCSALVALDAQTTSDSTPPQLPAKEKLHLYLLMGQSNMAGRGKLGAEDITPHPRVLVFSLANRWEAAVEPITRDKPQMLGVGPGLAFGKAMAEKTPGATIGLVPCAVGGTALKRWQHGGDLYSNAVHRAKLAARDGTLKGILWHQGESDSGTATNANTYGERLAGMIQDIRADLAAPGLPVVVGQIGEFLYDRGPDKSPYARVVNGALAALPDKVPATACAPSKGLNHKGDQLHFDASSQREFGRRYAAAMLRLQPARKPAEPER